MISQILSPHFKRHLFRYRESMHLASSYSKIHNILSPVPLNSVDFPCEAPLHGGAESKAELVHKRLFWYSWACENDQIGSIG